MSQQKECIHCGYPLENGEYRTCVLCGSWEDYVDKEDIGDILTRLYNGNVHQGKW